MPESIVLDTNVLVYAVDEVDDEELGMNCWYIVSNILMGDKFRVAIDCSGEILDEYADNLESINSHQARMIREFLHREIYQTKGEQNIVSIIPIKKREVEELLDLGFHDNDAIFVRISPRTELKTITSCDGNSFLDPEYNKWIRRNLEVGVLNIYQCKSMIET